MIDFWFSTGSTYTYLAVSRLDKVAAAEGVRFNWRPFSVRAIMREQNNAPFVGKPVKTAYMWRDIERRAAMYGLAAKAAGALSAEGVRPRQPSGGAGPRRRLGQGLHQGELSPLVRRRPGAGDGAQPVGQSRRGRPGDAARSVERAGGDDVIELYEAATDDARKLGIFGSPTFAVRGELFWGDDRLADALRWLRHGE